MTIPQGKERGYARVEFIAKLPEIRAALEQGQTMRMVYDAMRGGEISMSYSQFCRYASGKMLGVEGLVPARPRQQKDSPPVSGAAAVPVLSQSAQGVLPQGAGDNGPETPSGDRSPALKSSAVRTGPLAVAETFRPREVRLGDFCKVN